MTVNAKNSQSSGIEDWESFYSDLQSKGNIPNASCIDINQNNAIFRDMFQDLSEIKEKIRESGLSPVMTIIYADVLVIPDLVNWLLESSGLVIFARRIEVKGKSTIILDYQNTSSAQFVVFASEMEGTISVSAVKSSKEEPTIYQITDDEVSPGVTVNNEKGNISCTPLGLKQGIGFQLAEDMQLYLSNSFIFGSILYDTHQELAVSIFLWVKGWASQSNELEELFYRSASLATLLASEINASENGAKFVPYLTANIYTELAGAFASEAAKYESDYMQLNTQKVLTEENIALAKTMIANSESEIAYVNALLQQANENYDNAETAAKSAQMNFLKQQIAVDDVAADFQQIGIPAYEREQIIKAVVSLVKSVVTFGGAIALMAVGDEAAAPAAAEGAVSSVEAVADAAKTGSEVAKLAKNLGETMKSLKKLLEVLQKVYDLAKSIKDVAGDISSAKSQMDVIQELDDSAQGVDLSAADSWSIFKIQADNAMKDPIDLGIQYAKAYQEAMDILVVYGQSLAAAQLALIKAGQNVAAITFQLYYAKQKEENLKKLVDDLKVGEAPILNMMQQFYQKYLDGKSSLFAALKSYQNSYFYWALRQSSVQPKIVDPVSDLNAGIQDITKITMDKANALTQFDPPPQEMSNMRFTITDESILQQLRMNGKTTWILPLNDNEFSNLERVRLSRIRVWLEGVTFTGDSNSVFMTLTTTGNYLDRYKKLNYQFNSKELTRTFKYMVEDKGTNPDWSFDNGAYGFVQIDGAVDKEVAYAYFQPTPFSEWSISLHTDRFLIDYSNVSKITMVFEGTAIGSIKGRNLNAKTGE